MPARPPRTGRRAEALRRYAEMSVDDYRPTLNAMSNLADEYAGIPMPINGQNLVVHKGYKFAHVFNRKPEKPTERIRNSWRSMQRGYNIHLVENPKTGKVELFRSAPPSRIGMQISTMGSASAWDSKAEGVAMERLGALIKPHLFEMYRLTGAFLETSKRSGVVYMFRRLRPTIAMSGRTGEMQVLCGLCLHPIGYYEGTWAGSMVPTDEVIAHLLLMRGDEHCFWKQANQHPAWRAESGL